MINDFLFKIFEHDFSDPTNVRRLNYSYRKRISTGQIFHQILANLSLRPNNDFKTTAN